MSSKFKSAYFRGTSGGSAERAKLALGILPGEPTATVWQYIEPTAKNYPGAEIPRSFNVSTPNETFWTHGNATEHMYEAVMSLKGSPMLANTNPALYAQFILYDYRKALIAATNNGFSYGRLYSSGHWTFKFSKSRSADANPVVVHAMFTGLK